MRCLYVNFDYSLDQHRCVFAVYSMLEIESRILLFSVWVCFRELRMKFPAIMHQISSFLVGFIAVYFLSAPMKK